MEAIYQFLAQQAPAFALAFAMLAVCWLVMKITLLCCRQKRARGALLEKQNNMTKKAEEQAAKMGQMVERQEELNKKITLIRLTLEDMNRKLDRYLQIKNPNSPISRSPHLPPVQ